MNRAEFIKQVSDILEIDPENLNGSEILEEIGNWDSLSIISFVAMVDAELNRIVSPEKLRQAKTIDDLVELASI